MKGTLVAAAPWLRLSLVAALLAVTGNIVALSTPKIYAALTPAFLPQALAQDIADLTVVAPLWLIAARLALKGSLKAYLVWLGVLAFTVYNYVIYTFSVPFGPLFLWWVCVLGLSLYSLIGGLCSLDWEAARESFETTPAATAVGWFLIFIGAAFTALWLSEDLPALVAGSRPKSLSELGLPTNPVHVLDLAFFLPATFLTAVQLLKGRSLGFCLAPLFLVFLMLIGVPILMIPVIESFRGNAAAWEIWIPIGTTTAVSGALLRWFFSKMPAATVYQETRKTA